MIRKTCIVLVFLCMLILTSCNKVDEDVKIGKDDIVSKTNVQTKEPEPEKNNVDSNNYLKGSDTSNDINYKIKEARYTDKKVSINYPQIMDLNDNNRQNKINEILKSEALIIVKDLYEDANDVSINVNYKIMLASQNVVSIQYYGYGFAKGAAYPLNLLYTINIDINKGCKLALKDYINIDKAFIDKFRKYKVNDPNVNQMASGAFEYILRTYSADDLHRYFNGADSSYKNSAFTFSYFTKDALGISIEVPHAAGDHTEIELKYQDIRDNIKTENEIWKDFSDVLSANEK